VIAMTKVGVVGAGVMGTGVADNAARSGHDVVLVDVRADALTRAVEQIRRDCRMSRLLTGVALDPAEIIARITTAGDVSAVRDCEIVVENVTENWDVKRPVYEVLDGVCAPAAVFIANTSAIPITRIASVTSRPDRVVGVHFMNPVPMKDTVELIPGRLTSDDTVRRTRAFLDSLGKTPIPVKDSCGFISNRILMLTVNEAAFLVYEGVATAEQVDEVFRGCFGHPMGPLETADLIGVDTILYSVEVLHEHFADPKYRPCPLLREMTAAGLHGRKTGSGFYDYDALGRPVAAAGTAGSAGGAPAVPKPESVLEEA
jgi:3-hydroxybutyryl-CoA dehydrogenase